MDVDLKISKLDKIKVTPINMKDVDNESIKSMKIEVVDESPKFENQLNSQNNFIKTRRDNIDNINDLELVWTDLTITAKVPQGSCCKKTSKDKILLNKVSGRVKSGECLAILGSTGAGKTTLLNYLSRKIESSNLKFDGNYLMNSEPINPEVFYNIATYVMQDDILEATMTPKEILMFTAKMKFNLDQKTIEKKVFNMISDLHLNHCQNTRIGDNIVRGVSGGERKRTSIGVELISDPKIIFMDEPTTGLDSYNAYELILLLRKLAEKDKIVIFTIHQPSSQIYELMDKINILALGKTVYFGPQDQCYNFFEYLKIPIPISYNPFEHFMEMTNLSTVLLPKVLTEYPGLNKIENIQERYEVYVSNLNTSYEAIKKNYIDESSTMKGISVETKKYIKENDIKRGFFYQFALIFARTMIITMRNPKVLVIKIVQGLFTALLIAILFTRVTKDYSGIQDRIGIVLMSIVSTVLNGAIQTLLVLADENKVLLRERANKLYSIGAYFLAKILAEIPVFFVANVLFGTVVYYSVEFNDTYMGVLIYLSLAGSSYAFFLGTLSTNQEVLLQLNTTTIIPLLLLSGFFASADNFAPYLIPFKYISAFKYGYQVISNIEFSDLSALNCQNLNPNMCTPLASRFTFFEPFYASLIGIACIIVFFKTLAFIIIYFNRKIKV